MISNEKQQGILQLELSITRTFITRSIDPFINKNTKVTCTDQSNELLDNLFLRKSNKKSFLI